MPFDGDFSEADEAEPVEAFTLCPVCSDTGIAPNKYPGCRLVCWCCGGQTGFWPDVAA